MGYSDFFLYNILGFKVLNFKIFAFLQVFRKMNLFWIIMELWIHVFWFGSFQNFFFFFFFFFWGGGGGHLYTF